MFVVTVVACFAVAGAYLLTAVRRARVAPVPTGALGSPSSVSSARETTPSPEINRVAPADVPPAPSAAARGRGLSNDPEVSLLRQPRLFMLNLRDSPNRGTVESAGLGDVGARQPTDLHCERIHVSAGRGICLSRQVHLVTVETVVTLVNGQLAPLSTMRTDGIPTRARISPDGRRAAFTVFVTGHSYADAQMSTATFLLDAEKGSIIANLEEFVVVREGNAIKGIDFNYWGVTFQKDSNFFYATLRTAGVNYLVRGDIAQKIATVVHEGVECPGLSPDETRIAFKKLVARNNWRLTVLDLRTLAETPLAETRSVDDQPEWLDDSHVLYSVPDPAPWMSVELRKARGS